MHSSDIHIPHTHSTQRTPQMDPFIFCGTQFMVFTAFLFSTSVHGFTSKTRANLLSLCMHMHGQASNEHTRVRRSTDRPLFRFDSITFLFLFCRLWLLAYSPVHCLCCCCCVPANQFWRYARYLSIYITFIASLICVNTHTARSAVHPYTVFRCIQQCR